ncbi:MAG: ATPase [Micavibrio sp.]|nr:ATPase [Micavibrio sp.]|tara:strand:+ start:417 stop:1580 length:1164 start_codon:yes stop_codon:yes gene_type:complete
MSLFGDEVEADPVQDIEMTPDAPHDGVAGVMPPKDNPLCFGHNLQEQGLLKLYNAGKMPHALIFAGAEGIGKLTFAYRVARFLLVQELTDPNQDALFGAEDSGPSVTMDVEPEHATYRRIAAGGHSDFKIVDRLFDDAKGRKKDTVEVAEIRKVAPFLHMTAGEAGWRVVIINDADTMNRSSQNAILKILEEPPENTLLILIAHRVGALIPTIRSRARVINFQPLSIEDFQTLLQRQGHHLGLTELQALYTLSEASIGRALDLIDQGGLDVMGKVITMFEDYPDWKFSQIHVVAEDLSRSNNAQGFMMFQNVMLWIARQLTLAKARGQALPAGPLSSLDLFDTMIQNSSLEGLMRLCDALKDHFDTVNRGNLEKRQAVLKAFTLFTT